MKNTLFAGFLYTFFFALLFSPTNDAFAQKKTRKADRYFNGGAYYGAVKLYQKGIKKKDSADYAYRQYRIGECYKRMNAYQKSLDHFTVALLYGYNKPEIFLSLGDIYLTLGKSNEAMGMYKTFQREDTTRTSIAQKIASCELFQNSQNILSADSVYPIKSLNTRGSEYGISFWNNKLVYFSTGDSINGDNDISLRTGLGYSRMYISEYTSDGFSSGKPITALNKEESNEGTFTYDPRTGKLFGSRCEADQKNCYIFEAIVNKKGYYKERNKLQLGNAVYGIGHPFITADGNRIYFTSTMDGGYGAADLWYVERMNETRWGDPINCGDNINTEGSEVFPFVKGDKLYFTSNGHPSMGGLDLFVSRIEGDNVFSRPVNLGKPFNTSYDDLDLIISEDGKISLFVSNRENATQSDDIYAFNGIPMPMVFYVQVIDQKTKEPLPEAKVKLYAENKEVGIIQIDSTATGTILGTQSDTKYIVEASYKGLKPVRREVSPDAIKDIFSAANTIIIPISTDKTIRLAGKIYDQQTQKAIPEAKVVLIQNDTILAEIQSDTDGDYSFPIPRLDEKYTVEASLKNHKTTSKTLLLDNKDTDFVFCKKTAYDMDIALLKLEIGKEIQIKDIYYEFDQARLLEASKKELDFLIELMREYPQMRIEIGSHTDSRGSLTYNDNLSGKRAKSVVDYLAEHGIVSSRFQWKGHGERKLVIANAKTEEEHQMNRRTTFKILTLGKHTENTRVKVLTTESLIENQNFDVMDYNKFHWLQITTPLNSGEIDSPLFKEIEKLTGKTVQLKMENDGQKAFSIGPYNTEDEVKKAQALLEKNGIQTVIKQHLKQ